MLAECVCRKHSTIVFCRSVHSGTKPTRIVNSGTGPSTEVYIKVYQRPLAQNGSEGPEGHHADLHCWVRHLPTNYTAQLALMGWFLTLTSKMTGHRIPGQLLLSSTVQWAIQ